MAQHIYMKGSWERYYFNYIKDNKVSCNNDICEDIDLLETILMVFQYLKGKSGIKTLAGGNQRKENKYQGQ